VSTVRFRRPYNVLIGAVLVVALSAGFASVAPAQQSAPYVKVFVDNNPVYFDQPPVIVDGRVLVPLRGVFERLGATVQWDPASQTVLAQSGATSVSLHIGSAQAFVNGQPQYLDVPPMLVGARTMVPLRFVSQALGAGVTWDTATSTVLITSSAAVVVPPQPAVPPSTSYPPAQPYQPAPPAPAVTTVSGTVVGVNASTYPGQLVVRVPSGEIQTYTIVSGTTIVRVNALTGASRPVSLSQLRSGDSIQLTTDQSGTAQNVQATFTPAPAPSPAPVPPSGYPGAITSVSVTPAGRPLGPGNVMTVIAAGPAHWNATFAITGLRRGLPMNESTTQPGTYIGYYAVQPGDYAVNTSVVITMAAPDGEVITATAPSPVSITASAGAPPVVAGPPVITSPTPGSAIRPPFTVTGSAPPGALVKVQADYTTNIILFPVQGTLGTQTVTADNNGYWAVTFNAGPPLRGATVTISATLVDNNGAARSQSTTVNTTMQ
jgi:Copper amine oxidase N-terminal domain